MSKPGRGGNAKARQSSGGGPASQTQHGDPALAKAFSGTSEGCLGSTTGSTKVVDTDHHTSAREGSNA